MSWVVNVLWMMFFLQRKPKPLKHHPLTTDTRPTEATDNVANLTPPNHTLVLRPRITTPNYYTMELLRMKNANYSKPSQRDIDRAETDLLIALSQLTGRGFAQLAGWHESKVSRTNWRDIAMVFCIFRMATECSPVSRALQDLYRAVGKKKSPVCKTEDFQITMEF